MSSRHRTAHLSLPGGPDQPAGLPAENTVMTGPGAVEVSMHIAAAPEDLFGYLTDPARYIEWMSSQATLEPAPGGTYQVQMAGHGARKAA